MTFNLFSVLAFYLQLRSRTERSSAGKVFLFFLLELIRVISSFQLNIDVHIFFFEILFSDRRHASVF